MSRSIGRARRNRTRGPSGETQPYGVLDENICHDCRGGLRLPGRRASFRPGHGNRAPAGTAPVTVEGYGYGPGQPGFNGYGPAYDNGYAYDNGWGPFAPVGAVAAGVGAVGSDVVGTTGFAVGGPMYAARFNPRCGVIHDFNGRYTSVCGP
jgi:hypothetical protein